MREVKSDELSTEYLAECMEELAGVDAREGYHDTAAAHRQAAERLRTLDKRVEELRELIVSYDALREAATKVDQALWCETKPPYTHWHVSDADFSAQRQALSAINESRAAIKETP